MIVVAAVAAAQKILYNTFKTGSKVIFIFNNITFFMLQST
jgi:hypothetical protein